jgi:hypothetical protein
LPRGYEAKTVLGSAHVLVEVGGPAWFDTLTTIHPLTNPEFIALSLSKGRAALASRPHPTCELRQKGIKIPF